MGRFYIRERPYIGRVFPERIAAQFSFVCPFITAFSRVFLRDSHSVQIEVVVLTNRVPQDHLMAWAKPPSKVMPMTEFPYYPVLQMNIIEISHYRMDQEIKR